MLAFIKNIFNKQNSIQSRDVEENEDRKLIKKNCIDYIKGQCVDEQFLNTLKSMSQKNNMSEYEIIEYLLDANNGLNDF